MKKITYILIFIILTTFLFGCTSHSKKTTSEVKTKHPDYLYLYKNILDRYKRSCETNDEADYDNKNNLSTGLCEAASEIDLPHKVGYKLIDLNDDGVDELVISLLEKKGYYNYIIAIYQYIDGKGVQKIEDGWARNKYYLLKGNILLNEASGGAFCSHTSKIKMTGHKLKTIAMLILDSELPEDEDEVAKPFYLYNPNGKATKKKEFYITRNEWEKKIKEWESEIVRVDFIPFANYK